jgi:hypothetical protein
MCTATAPLSASEKFALVESLLAELAGEDAAGKPVALLAEGLRAQERIEAVGAALQGRLLQAFDAQRRVDLRRAAEYPDLAGELPPGHQRPDRRIQSPPNPRG